MHPPTLFAQNWQIFKIKFHFLKIFLIRKPFKKMPFLAFFASLQNFKAKRIKFWCKVLNIFPSFPQIWGFFYKFKLLVFSVFSIQQQKRVTSKGVTE
jgi:hypothetical protein